MLIIKRHELVELSLYLMVVGFVFSVSINGKLDLNKIGIFIRFVSICLQFVLVIKKLEARKIILLILLFILSLIYLDKQWIYFLQIFLICDILKKYKNKYVIRLFKKISLFSIILVFISFYLGFSSYRLMYGFVGTIAYKRETYGLVHPNTLSLLFLSFIIMDYLDTKKIIRVLIFIIFIYFLTRTRSIVGLFAILYTFLKLSEVNKFKYLLYLLSKYISLIILILLTTSKFYLIDKNFVYFNKLLSSRLELWHFNFSIMNAKNFLFGNNYLIEIMDNSYLMLHNYGGVLLIIFYFYIHFKSLNKLKKQNRTYEIIFILSFSIMFNFESSLIIPGYIFTIYYWFILYKSNCNLKRRTK